jgi:hypothetical protein
MVKPQVDVQSQLASLRPLPWRWHRDLTWPASSASLLGAAASGVAARSMTALSVPPIALACRWRLQDLARVHSSESMAAPLAMSELVRRFSTRGAWCSCGAGRLHLQPPC